MVILPVLWTLLGITALVLLIAFICYRIVFYAKKFIKNEIKLLTYSNKAL